MTVNKYTKRVSPAEEEEMIALRKRGKSIQEISDTLNFTPLVVINHLRDTLEDGEQYDSKKIKFERKRELVEAMVLRGYSKNKIAIKTGIPKENLHRYDIDKALIEKTVKSVSRSLHFPEERIKDIEEICLRINRKNQIKNQWYEIYAGATIWWYTDTVLLTNITIYDIEKEIQRREAKNPQRCVVRGCSRIVKSKAKALRKMLESGKMDINATKLIIRQMLDNQHLKNETGMDMLEEVLTKDKFPAIEKLKECERDIVQEEGDNCYQLRRRMTRARRKIEEIVEEMTFSCDKRDLPSYIQLQIENVIKGEIIDRSHKDILQKTTDIITSEIDTSLTAGKSPRTMATTIVFLGLLYHNINMNRDDFLNSTYTSESTLRTNGILLEKEIGLGFEKNPPELKILPLGKKILTRLKTIEPINKVRVNKKALLKIKEKNTEKSPSSILKEMMWILVSSTVPEYYCSRLLVTYYLFDGEKTKKEIFKLADEYFKRFLSSFPEGKKQRDKRRYIKYYALRISSNGGYDITTKITYIQSRDDKYYFNPDYDLEDIKQQFKKFEPFLSFCNKVNYDSEQCNTKREELIKQLI